MTDYDITEQSAGAADTDYVLGSDVTEWATGQRLRELKAAEQERDVLRECVEALCGEYADACELTEHYQAQLEETEMERGLFGDERDALRAEVVVLREALGQIANCGALTQQRMDRVSASEHDTLRLVKKIARHALAQPSKATERRAAMLGAQPMQIEVLVKERAALNAVQEAIVDILASVEPHTLDCGCCVRLPVSMFEAAGKAFAALAQPSKVIDPDFPRCIACGDAVSGAEAMHADCARTVIAERDEAEAEVGALRAALAEVIGVEERLTEEGYYQAHEDGESYRVARAALTQPSKAAERRAAMEKVCNAVRVFQYDISRRAREGAPVPAHDAWYSPAGIGLNRAMRELDALVALDKEAGHAE